MDPPNNHNYSSTPSSFLEIKEDQTSSSLSLSCPAFMNPTQDQGHFYYSEPQHIQLFPQEVDKINIVSSGGSCDHRPRAEEGHEFVDHDLKLSIWKSSEDHTTTNDVKINNIHGDENINSVKWMSSKMRMMRKMIMNPDQTATNNTPLDFTTQKFEVAKNKHPGSPTDHSTSSSSNNNTTIRVCADCNTTKTPLWRSGPRGPKSLCNACGIRQRKARRAMAAAAAAANGTILAVDAPSMKNSTAKVQIKEKKSRSIGGTSNGCLPFKKRCKLTRPPSRGRRKNKLCFEDLINVSKNSAFQRVFPQDERDAAILLMALSYGLVHG
ncbi:GATA transcription factor [Trema orientale]|uniref:GATA transcription factor n=1 Tax=Trema orientale TaxID=63057 RepID=A0A2P5EIK1_TREOI|nr:GATA transcription factor [Trema orientale]